MTKYICTNCGYTNKNDNTSEIKETIGCLGVSTFALIKIIFLTALFIVLLFFPPLGWIFAVCLLFIPIIKRSNDNKCPHCNIENCLIPIDSPKGKELLEKYYTETDECKQEKQTNNNEINWQYDKIKEDLIQTIIIIVIGIIALIIICTISNVNTTKTNNIDNQTRTQLTNNTNTPVKELERLVMSENECKTIYNSKMMNMLSQNVPDFETEVDKFYNDCGNYKSIRDKNSYISAHYFSLGTIYKEKYDFDNAEKYLLKALEYNLKSPDKINLEFIYSSLGDTYFNSWQMEKAKKYYKSACNTEKLYCLERIADCCYNLEQWDEAEMYYKKAITEALKIRPAYLNNPEKLTEIDSKIGKFQSILDGTFEQ